MQAINTNTLVGGIITIQNSLIGISVFNEIVQGASSIFCIYCRVRAFFTVTARECLVQFCDLNTGSSPNPVFDITAPGVMNAQNNVIFSGPNGMTSNFAIGNGTLRYAGNALREGGGTVNIKRANTLIDVPILVDGAGFAPQEIAVTVGAIDGNKNTQIITTVG